MSRERAAAVELRRVDPASPVAVTAVRSFLVEIDRRLAQGFDVETALASDAASRDTVAWVFLVALDDGEPVAGGGVRVLGRDPDDSGDSDSGVAGDGVGGVGEIKRMWVHEAWRGVGLGSRLLRDLEQEARTLGLDAVRLDTHRDLVEAVGLYGRAGYREIARYNDNPDAQAWFEKRLS